MRHNYKDISGLRSGRLIAIELSKINSRGAFWVCICDCGNKSIVIGSNLRNGRTKSCGCLRKELLIKRNTSHNMSKSAPYRTWRAMKNRCYNKKHPQYHDYGGRGVAVCDRWLNSFENFYSDMGDKPTSQHSIDKIDNNGNYEPKNCRWATATQQVRNQRISKRNTSGFTGVSFQTSTKKWRADIKVSEAHIYLGSFDNLEDACKARKDGEERYWGEDCV